MPFARKTGAASGPESNRMSAFAASPPLAPAPIPAA